MSLTNELTNWFGVGSVDFHANRASFRVLEIPREQSRCDNNFYSCCSKQHLKISTTDGSAFVKRCPTAIGMLGLGPELLPLG